MDINNKNELQTQQAMDSSQLFCQKVWETTLLSIKIVINDRLTCNVSKVYMYMILFVNIYAFLITMGLLI